MGGRGASSSSVGNIKTLQAQYDKLRERNIKLYNETAGFAITGDMERLKKRNKAYKEWLDNRNKLGKLKQQIDGERAKMVSEQEKKDNNKTFVNSYGEATRREITSSTYRRQQKRLEKSVRRNLGR